MSVDTVVEKTEEVIKLAAVLVADLDEATPDLSSDRHRRAYVRAVFAHVEGTLSGLKEILVEYGDLFGSRFSTGEAALLAEEAYGLKDDGSIRITQSFLRVAENVRFTLALAAKVSGSPTSVRYDDQGWAGFKESIRIRNRLMHPRSVADLSVSDAELLATNSARAWYKDAIVDVLLKVRAGVIERRGQF